jgi:hypothetical protein
LKSELFGSARQRSHCPLFELFFVLFLIDFRIVVTTVLAKNLIGLANVELAGENVVTALLKTASSLRL